jgi:hypothetical protein
VTADGSRAIEKIGEAVRGSKVAKVAKVAKIANVFVISPLRTGTWHHSNRIKTAKAAKMAKAANIFPIPPLISWA